MAKKTKVNGQVEVSLTEFLDFVMKSRATKITCVRNIKYREPYHPANDYYKPIRDALIEFHRKGKPKTFLASTLAKNLYENRPFCR